MGIRHGGSEEADWLLATGLKTPREKDRRNPMFRQSLIAAAVAAASSRLPAVIPYPEVMGPFVGTVEIVCGTLIILGLLTRLAAIPLIVIMVVAIVSTKVPIWAGHDIGIFHTPKLARYGFWSMAHEARDDFLMLLGSLYLLIAGAGAWSLDAVLARERVALHRRGA
jgi:uncharacterized membrane protein YphA (DoxX/SURF4 family)